jgi:hypothetical protein
MARGRFVGTSRFFRVLGTIYAALGVGFVGLWVWSAADGGLDAADPSDAFVLWARLALGPIFLALGVVYLVVVVPRVRRAEEERAAAPPS